MKTQIPYNAGDYVRPVSYNGTIGPKYIVMGHVWWPIEQCNAYYMLRVNEYGEPHGDAVPEYCWDNRITEPSKYQYFTPKAEAA